MNSHSVAESKRCFRRTSQVPSAAPLRAPRLAAASSATRDDRQRVCGGCGGRDIGKLRLARCASPQSADLARPARLARSVGRRGPPPVFSVGARRCAARWGSLRSWAAVRRCGRKSNNVSDNLTRINPMSTSAVSAYSVASASAASAPADTLDSLKRELLSAELRLAKARAAVASAEADVKVIGGKLRAFTR
jgi:hypothetical protein